MKLRLLLALISICSFHGVACAALRTVVLTGQQAPGTAAGVEFTDLYFMPPTPVGPVINNAGRVAFSGKAALDAGGGTTTGIWSDAGGALAAVAISGDQAPGTSTGVKFSTFKNPVLNEAGRTSFDGTVNTASATNAGIWTDSAAGLTLVARKGSLAPGAGAGVNFFTLFGPSVNDSGQTAFRAQLSGAGVTADNDVGIWAEKAGAVSLIARAGNAAPGTVAGITFDGFPGGPVLINSAGQVAFRGYLQGPGVALGVNRTGIWAERGGALSLIAREGNAVPTLPGLTFSVINDPVLNSDGQVAFVALLNNSPGSTNGAVFSEGGGSLAVVARKGDAAPGVGSAFNVFYAPLLNGDGQVAFSATLLGASNGIWAQRDGVLNLVARGLSQAPGAPAGVSFSSVSTFDNSAFNAASQVAFSATLSGPGISTTNDGGIWAQGIGGDLRLVAREGGQLEVSPGVIRTIAELFFAGGANTEDGRRSGLNDLGEVAFLATFTDGSSGIFVSDVAKAAPAAGDFDGDGDVDGADFLTWQRGLGRTGTGLPINGDANADGNVNGADLAVWQSNYGTGPAVVSAATVPEPGALLLAAIAAACLSRASRSRPS